MTRTEAIEQSRGPLAMTEENYRKVVAGEKTQTRRVLAIQPPDDSYTCCTVISTTGDKRTEGKRNWLKLTADKCGVVDNPKLGYFSPKYKPGEIYYLPEPVQLTEVRPHRVESECEGHYLWDTKAHSNVFDLCITHDDLKRIRARKGLKNWKQEGWRAPTTARFMLKSFAREFVRIKSVKAERLQDITPDDCRAEGHPKREDFKHHSKEHNQEIHNDAARDWFMDIWDLIDSKRPGCAWSANPWVWVYEFERVEVQP